VISSTFPGVVTFEEDDSTTLELDLYVTDVDNQLAEMNWSVFAKKSAESAGDALGKVAAKSPLPEATLEMVRLSPRRLALVNSNGDSIIIEIAADTHVAKFYAKPNFYVDGYNFIFVVNDSTTNADFGCDSVTTTVQILPANDAPVLAAIPALTFKEDSTVSIRLRDWFGYVNDVDNPDSTLEWYAVNGQNVTAVVNDSAIVITSAANWFGKDTVLVIVSDNLLRDSTELAIQVTAVNDPPVFHAIADISVPEDDTFFVNLNDYVEDVETADDDLVFSVARVTGGNQLSPAAKPNPDKLVTGKKSTAKGSGIKTTAKRSVFYTDSTPKDSIVVDINNETHIAAIYGTANYYTAAQSFHFYVSDGTDSDTAAVSIAIVSVNDKPVLSALPPIVFREDSIYTLFLSQWDSLVYDVEDSDDSLRWSFNLTGAVLLDYDSLARKLTLFGADDYHGSAVLTAMVTDLGSLSDTIEVAVTIQPINDPPVIDSSLVTIIFDQKDTLDFALDQYVHDPDHAPQDLTWQITAGKKVHSNFNSNTRTLTIWSDKDWCGNDTLLAVVTDPFNGSDSESLFITITDTTRPTFEIVLYQNQVNSKYVEIDLYPSELLAANALIKADAETLTTRALLDEDSVSYYNATYKIEKTGTVQIEVQGTDLAGNVGDLSYTFGVAIIERKAGGTLTDPDSILSFLFMPNSVEMDLCALFLPSATAVPVDTALGKMAIPEGGVAVSKEFDFRIPVQQLENDARLLFNLERMEFLHQYANELGIYRWQNGKWKYLTTYTSREKGTYWAYSDQPGIYQIRIDPANPVVVLPEKMLVSQNYPNPFNSLTTIKYTIGAGEFQTFEQAFEQLVPYNVSIKIYNLLGQEVKTLVKEPQLPGFYSITWDGKNRYGQLVSTGLYFYQVIIGNKVFNKKMTVLK